MGIWALCLALNPAMAVDGLMPTRPAGAAVEGNLWEWSTPPMIISGPPGDYRAEVWVAFDTDGLTIAARIEDDNFVELADDDPSAYRLRRSDHLELWLAFDTPEWPDLSKHPDAERCLDAKRRRGSECEWTWLDQEQERQSREQLEFQAQFLVSPVAVFALENEDGSVRRVGTELARTHEPGVVMVEARVPLDELPRTQQAQLRTLRLLVTGVDNDQGFSKQEHVFSAVRGARYRQPETWPALELPVPVPLTAVRGDLAALEGGSWSWRPTTPVRRVHAFPDAEIERAVELEQAVAVDAHPGWWLAPETTKDGIGDWLLLGPGGARALQCASDTPPTVRTDEQQLRVDCPEK